jgi:hypothetical protein
MATESTSSRAATATEHSSSLSAATDGPRDPRPPRASEIGRPAGNSPSGAEGAKVLSHYEASPAGLALSPTTDPALRARAEMRAMAGKPLLKRLLGQP